MARPYWWLPKDRKSVCMWGREVSRVAGVCVPPSPGERRWEARRKPMEAAHHTLQL